MQLRSRFTRAGDLELEAATFNASEFKSLEQVLRRAGVPLLGRIHFKRGRKDPAGRPVRLYRVPKRIIKTLESILDGTFQPNGNFNLLGGTGKSFYCLEVKGPGCEDIIADDQDLALVKCGLIAGRNLWFGATAHAGSCL